MRSAVNYCTVVLLLLTIGGIPSQARIRHVPNDFNTIQAAINAAQDGDTVLVQPETYVENIFISGKDIVIGSLYLTTGDESFIDRTIIDGERIDSGVSFRAGVTSACVITGFTITNGRSNYGGGIYVNASEPTLDHLLITGNRAVRYGGGIYATQGSDPTLINLTVARNTSDMGNGGMVTFAGSTGELINCIFYDNDRVGMPGGMPVSYSDIEGDYGGAGNFDQDPSWVDPDNGDFHLNEDSPCIDTGDPDSPQNRDGSRADIGCFFYNQGNVHIFVVPDEYDTIGEAIDAAADGDTVLVHPGRYVENISFGGKEIIVASLYLITDDEDYIHQTIIDGDSQGSVVTFDQSETENSILTGFTIRNGQAAQGGGILISRANPTLIGLEVEENTAQAGGGIYMLESDCILQNVSVIMNNSNRDGSGISCYNSAPIITNSTICRNTTIREGGGFYVDENCQVQPTSSIFWENDQAQISGDGELRVTYSDVQDGFDGEGNIDADPLFADPDNGDFHLTWENWRDEDETRSPCIDAGDPDRELDPENTRADMGTYYWHQEPYRAIIIVDPQALNSQINTGEIDTLDYNVANEGDTLLIYQTDIEITQEPEGAPRRDRRGGPDEIEYEWRDNDEGDGPGYGWIDVSHREGVVEVEMGNDVNRGPFDLGFEFNYYDNVYTSIRMCSNGWASFTSTRNYYSYENFGELPANRAPDNFLGVAMSDWDPRGGGEYYFWSDEDMAVLSWVDVPHFAVDGTWTFQIILFANGLIKFQYEETGAPDGRQLVGVQDFEKEFGFEILRDEEDYLVAGRAIAISRVWEEWIRIEPTSGTIAVNNNRDMNVIINAEELIEGNYGADIHMFTNDPENPDVVVPVSIEVLGLPLINVTWDNELGYPDSVNWNSAFNNVLVGYDYDLDLDVHNDGSANLVIDSVRVDNEAFYVEDDRLTVSAGNSSEMTVTFSTEEEGRHEGAMIIYSNDPEQGEYEVTLVAIAEILRPVIEVTWSEEAGYPDVVDWNRVNDELFSTIEYEIPIVISNTGRRDLEIIEITSGNEAFSADADNFVVEPNDEQQVMLSFETDEGGDFATVITIRNNTDINPQYPVSVRASALNPPVITLEPDEIVDSLYVDWVAQHTINLANDGEALLGFMVEHEIINEPERDFNVRSLRGTGEAIGPHRDDAGDLIGSFAENINNANQYSSCVGWDYDNERMWVTNYSPGACAAAYTHDANYEEFEEVIRINTGNNMDACWANGLLFIPQSLGNANVNRFDEDGQNIGAINAGVGNCYGLAWDSEENLLFVMESGNNYAIHVRELTDDNEIGEELGVINNHMAYHNNVAVYGLEWVGLHADAPLWMTSSNQNRVYQIAVDRDEWTCIDSDETVNFACGGIGQMYCTVAHDGEYIWASGYTAGDIRIYDDGVLERGWISYEPIEGEVTGGNNFEITLTLDARHRPLGFYEADVIFRSNDPHNHVVIINVRLYISQPPNLVVEWDENIGFPGEVNWNQAYADLYNNVGYDIELTCYNYDDETINVNSIEFQGDGAAYYSVDHDEFTIDPDEQVSVTVTLEADESGEHASTLVINSDAEDREEYPVQLVGETGGPPVIILEPEELNDSFRTGETANHNLNIANIGESRLLLSIQPVLYSEPERDDNSRSLRSTHNIIGPHRDDPGDLLASIGGINQANIYIQPTSYDAENERMWVTCYNGGWGPATRAYTFDNDYENVEQVAQINPGYCMDGTWLNGLYYTAVLGQTVLQRFDADGRNVGNINMGHNGYGFGADNENSLIFIQTTEGNQPIHVYPVDDDGNLGQQVGLISNHLRYHNNTVCYGLEWVEEHEDGPLWMTATGSQQAYQIAVNLNNWQCTETVQSFAVGVSVAYDHVAHDGENLWIGGYSAASIRIYDDGVNEIRWLSTDIDEAEIAGDNSLDVTVTLNANRLGGGEYTGALIITNNDPENPEVEFPVTINVEDAPDIDVVWDSDFGYPDVIDWNLAYDGIYSGLEYDFTLTVISSGVTELEVDDIEVGDGAFSPNLNRFNLDPEDRQDVEVRFSPDRDGAYNTTITFISNSEVHPELEINMVAEVENAPSIAVDPAMVEEFPRLSEIVERTIIVENNGEALLRFETDIEITGEPDRDINARSLRDTKAKVGPRRDDAGDLIATINGVNTASNYTHAAGYDWDTGWMWFTSYTSSFVRAYSFDDDYQNVQMELNINLANPMDGAWLNGIFFTSTYNNANLQRFDTEGNNLGSTNLGRATTGYGADVEESLLFTMDQASPQSIHVYPVDGNGDLGDQIGLINYHTPYHNNVPVYTMEWVAKHPDGQLWMTDGTGGNAYQILVDTDEWQAVETVQSFRVGSTQPYDPVAHDGYNIWCSDYAGAQVRVYDDGITEPYWIMLEPIEGEVPSGDDNSLELTLTLTTIDLIIGDYTAEIHFLSNDPTVPDYVFNVDMHVLEAPDIDVSWEHFDEANPDLIDWDDYHQEVFADYEYRVPITISNLGEDVLSVESITAEGEYFIADPSEFDIDPDDEREVEFIFEGPEPGEFNDVMTITSNDPDEETVTLRLHVTVIAVPHIVLDTEEIVDELEAESIAEHTVNISNTGAADLRWWSEIEVQRQPERDEDLRTLRQIDRGIPVRDDLGELITSFSWQRSGDNRHKAGIAWDRETEWMWLTCYNTDYLGAVDPADDYQEVIAWQIAPQRPMGAAWIDGVIYILNWGRNWLGRWDANGNNLGNLNVPFRPTALTSSDEYLFVMVDDADRDIYVLNTDGNEVGLIDNYQRLIEGNSRSIQWVNLHPDGELWVNTPEHVWQIDIDADWQAEELVQDFAWDGNQEWDGIGHDGKNLWLGAWNQGEYYIVDDGIAEARWLTFIPARGIITPDENLETVVTLDGRVDYAGEYESDLHIMSNDPVNSDVVVNVQLTVTGEADITVEPVSIDFGEVEHGFDKEAEFRIRNDGYDDLTVSEIAIEGEFFNLVDAPDIETVLRPHTEIVIIVAFAPDEDELGDFFGTVTIASDDPDEEVVEVDLQGTSIYIEHPPEVVVQIEDLELDEDFDPFVVADLDTVFYDPNGDELYYSTESSDENVILEIVAGSQLRIDSADDWYGEAEITVIADDSTDAGRDDASGRSLRSTSAVNRGGLTAVEDGLMNGSNPRRDLTAELTFHVTVGLVNDAPEIVSAIPDQEFDEDTGPWEIADLDTVFTDVEGDTLDIEVSGDESLTIELSDENVLTLRVEDNFYGADLRVTVSASDAEYTTNDDFLVTILNVNDPPEVVEAIEDTTFEEDSDPWDIADLDDVFFDIDDDELSFDVDTEDPITWDIDRNNILELDAPQDFNGENLQITITADDGQGGMMRARFNIDPTSGSGDIPIGGFLDYTVNRGGLTASDLLGGADIPVRLTNSVMKHGQQVVRATHLGSGDIPVGEIRPDNGPVRYIRETAINPLQSNEVAVNPPRLTDIKGILNTPSPRRDATVSEGFTLTITPVNDPPVWVDVPETVNGRENSEISFNVEGSDVDGDELDIDFASDDLPEEARFTDRNDGTGTFTWQTTFDDAGEYHATLTLSDAEYNIEAEVAITVENVNRRPVYTEETPTEVEVNENALCEFIVSGSDPDDDDLDIRYYSADIPDTAEFVFDGESSGAFSWQTTYEDEGQYTARFTLSDYQFDVIRNITITVLNVNRRPVWTEAPEDQAAREGDLIEFTMTAEDPDGEDITIAYASEDLPPDSVDFDFDGESSATFSWQTDFDDEGNYSATFTVSDGNLDLVTEIALAVGNVNRRPQWDELPDPITVSEGELIEFHVAGSDPDEQELTITEDIPEGAEFTDNRDGSGDFSWQTYHDDEGEYVVTLTLSDGDLTRVAQISITVEPDHLLHVGEGNEFLYHTIQGALDISSAGDTVLVEPGEYYENIDMRNGIVLGSLYLTTGNEEHINQTIIDGSEENPVFLVRGCRDERTSIIGFKIQNGYNENNGGGIHLRNGSIPTIRNCVIRNNHADQTGGGIYGEPSCSPLILDCTIIANSTQHGGGLSVGGNTVIDNCYITRNTASQVGGAVVFDGGEPIIRNSIINQNVAEIEGSGIVCSSNANPTIENCRISGNTGSVGGGGIIVRGHAEIRYCTITNNEVNTGDAATGFGGGIFCDSGSNPNISYCIISSNISDGVNARGGGIGCSVNSRPSISNCTIIGNFAWVSGGGVFIRNGSHPRIMSSILWNNLARNDRVQNQIEFHFNEQGQVTISYSDIAGGEEAIVLGDDNSVVNWGEGNIDSDPLFVDPDNSDYHLTWENYPEYDETMSPCIDSGDPDSDDDPDDTRADMGALYFEHEPVSDISVEPESIDFGNVSYRQSEESNLVISNIGAEDLIIVDIDIQGVGFDTDFEDELVIEPGNDETISVTFEPDEPRDYEAELTIESNDPNESRFVIQLTGVGVNDPPEVVNPIDDVELNEDFDPFVIADLDTIFTDPNGDELTFDVVSSDTNLVVELIDGSQLQLSAVENWNGDATVTVSANDGVNDGRDRGPVRHLRSTLPGSDDIPVGESAGVAKLASHKQSTSKLVHSGLAEANIPVRRDAETDEQFTVTVNPVNDPPVWTEVPDDTTVSESDLIEFDIVGEDIDSEDLTITDDIPEGAEFTDNGDGTGHFSWQTGYFDAGEYALMFTISDEEYNVETTISIEIFNVNRAPEWTQAPEDQEINENQLLEFTVTGEDPDGDNVEISARFADLPEAADFTFDGEHTGTFTWQTTYDDEGSYTVEFTISDGDMDVVSEITITVLNVNRTPVWVNAPQDQEVNENQRLQFSISGSDPDGDDLNITYSSENLPETVVYNFDDEDNVGTFTWNVSFDDAGDYTALFMLTDGDFEVIDTIGITVHDVNRAPEWTNFQNEVEVDENELLNLQVSGNDPDGDDVTIDFASDDLPEEAEFTDNSDGTATLTWQTGYEDSGEYHGTFTLSDNEFDVEADVTIRVLHINRPPVWTDIPDTLEVNENALLQFRVTGEDPDRDNLTIDFDPNDLPEAASFTDNGNGTGDFSWRPGYDDAGEYQPTFTLSDGDYQVDSAVVITVIHVNRPPVWIDAPENQAVNEGDEVSFIITAEDPDGDEIDMTDFSEDLPDEADFTFDGESEGRFTWQTGFEDEGNYHVTFTISDDEFDVEATITISVGDVNRPPEWVDPPDAVEVDEDEVLEVVVVGSDPDEDEIEITYYTNDIPDAAEFSFDGEDTGTLTWQTTYEDAGEYTATFILSDQVDEEFDDTLNVRITVIDVNRTPEVVEEIDDVTINEDPDPRRVNIADLDDVFSDPDGDELYFDFSGDSAAMNMNIDGDNVLYFSPDENYNLPDGAQITVTADDRREDMMAVEAQSDGNVGPMRQLRSMSANRLLDFNRSGGIPRRDDTVDETFTLTINSVNDDPVWDDVPETAEAQETETVEFNVTGSDVDGDDLSIEFTSDDLPEAAVFEDFGDGSGRFTWETSFNDAGNYTATFTLSDGDLTDVAEVVITITNLNRAPVWTDAPGEVTVDENEELRFTVTGEDPDGEELTISYSSVDLPDEVEFTDNRDGSGTFVWQTDYEDEGNYTARFVISDGDLADTTEVSIRIIGVNRAPQIVQVPESIEVAETQLIRFRVAATDPDRDDITITYSSDDLPEAAQFRFDEQTAGHFNWQTTYEDAGEFTATFIASDGELTDTADVPIIVNNVNRAPVWVDVADTVEVNEEESLEFVVTGEDPDGQELTTEMTSDDLPEAAEFTDRGDGSGALTWEVGYEDAGEYRALFTISDGDLSDEVEVIFTVIDVNRPPVVLRPINDIRIDEDPDPRLRVVADLDTIFSDPDGDELTFSHSDTPGELNMEIDDDNVLFFNPEDNFNIPGELEIIVTVDDGGGENRAPARDVGPVRQLRSVIDPFSRIRKPGRDYTTAEVFILAIQAVPDPPEWTDIPEEITHFVNERIFFSVAAIDVDDDELEIRAVVPEGAEFTDNGNGTGEFNWMTTVDDEGDYEVNFELRDGTFVVETTVPIHVRSIRELTIQLEENWNLISVNIELPEGFYREDEDRGPDVILMLEQLRIDEDNHRVERMKDERGDFYVPAWDFNNILYWNLEEGYQIQTSEDCELTWSGIPIPADADIHIEAGWNMIAYFPEYDLPADYNDGDNPFYVLSPIIDVVAIVKNAWGEFIWPNYNFSNMRPWTAGQGYQINLSEDAVLNYPEPLDRANVILNDETNTATRWIKPSSTGSNMSVLVNSISGASRLNGSQIAAFSSSGKIVGVATIDNRQSTIKCGLAVWGDDVITDQIDGLLEGEAFELRYWDGELEQEYCLEGNVREGQGLVYETDGFLVLDADVGAAVTKDWELLEAYPNPFNAVTKLTYQLLEASHVSLQVFDIKGRLVTTLVDDRITAGRHEAIWNGRDVVSGIYLLRLKTESFTMVRKLTLVK